MANNYSLKDILGCVSLKVSFSPKTENLEFLLQPTLKFVTSSRQLRGITPATNSCTIASWSLSLTCISHSRLDSEQPTVTTCGRRIQTIALKTSHWLSTNTCTVTPIPSPPPLPLLLLQLLSLPQLLLQPTLQLLLLLLQQLPPPPMLAMLLKLITNVWWDTTQEEALSAVVMRRATTTTMLYSTPTIITTAIWFEEA